jgi:hypothetical protein
MAISRIKTCEQFLAIWACSHTQNYTFQERTGNTKGINLFVRRHSFAALSPPYLESPPKHSLTAAHMVLCPLGCTPSLCHQLCILTRSRAKKKYVFHALSTYIQQSLSFSDVRWRPRMAHNHLILNNIGGKLYGLQAV